MGSLCSGHARQELKYQRDQAQRDKLGHEQEMKQIKTENQNLEQKYREAMSEQNQMEIRNEVEQRYNQLFPKESALYNKLSLLRPKIVSMRPGQSGCIDNNLQVPDNLCISLFGETGTGKTSLINSLICAVNGKLSEGRKLETAPEKYQGAHTLERLIVSLTKHLSVMDNRGINTERSMDSDMQMEVIRSLGK